MTNDRNKFPLGLLIGFTLLSMAIIQAVISDIVIFRTFDDIVGIPAALMFLVPVVMLYRDNSSKTALQVFIIEHILALSLLYFNHELEFISRIIVIVYCAIAIGTAVNALHRMSDTEDIEYIPDKKRDSNLLIVLGGAWTVSVLWNFFIPRLFFFTGEQTNHMVNDTMQYAGDYYASPLGPVLFACGIIVLWLRD